MRCGWVSTARSPGCGCLPVPARGGYASSSTTPPMSLALCARPAIRRWAWCCRGPTLRRWRCTCRPFRAVPPGRYALVVVDGAGWHGEAAAQGLKNLTLLKLPPASPELNPVEQLWQQLRQRHLAKRCFEDYEDIVQACCAAWNAFTALPGALRRLCSRQWATLEP